MLALLVVGTIAAPCVGADMVATVVMDAGVFVASICVVLMIVFPAEVVELFIKALLVSAVEGRIVVVGSRLLVA